VSSSVGHVPTPRFPRRPPGCVPAQASPGTVHHLCAGSAPPPGCARHARLQHQQQPGACGPCRATRRAGQHLFEAVDARHAHTQSSGGRCDWAACASQPGLLRRPGGRALVLPPADDVNQVPGVPSGPGPPVPWVSFRRPAVASTRPGRAVLSRQGCRLNSPACDTPWPHAGQLRGPCHPAAAGPKDNTIASDASA
jgi:hypothetical protein